MSVLDRASSTTISFVTRLPWSKTYLDIDEHGDRHENAIGYWTAGILSFNVETGVDCFDCLETVKVQRGCVIPVGERVVHGRYEGHE